MEGKDNEGVEPRRAEYRGPQGTEGFLRGLESQWPGMGRLEVDHLLGLTPVALGTRSFSGPQRSRASREADSGKTAGKSERAKELM